MISILMNTLNRGDLTPDVVSSNFANTGHTGHYYEVIITDQGSDNQYLKEWVRDIADISIFENHNIGNPQGLNQMIKRAKGDIIVVMGNDIKMHPGWLKAAVNVIEANEDIGLLGFEWRSGKQNIWKGQGEDIGGHKVRTVRYPEAVNIFGTWVFHRRVFEKIGYFATFSKYGQWDGDYSKRALCAGFVNGYMVDYPSKHIGTGKHDRGQYRALKNAEMSKAKRGLELRGLPTPERYYVNEKNEMR